MAIAPSEAVEELGRQVLLQHLVEVRSRDQAFEHQDLADLQPEFDPTVQAMLPLLFGQVPALDHELQEGLVQQIGTAVDRDPVFQDDFFLERFALDFEHG